MKIILFGGCFDPIHFGHLLLAESAREYLKSDKVIFIPSGVSPHKIRHIASSKHRHNMAELAIKGNKCFYCSDIETKNKNKSYTYDTINSFKKIYNKDTILFLTGIDALLDIDTWAKGRALLDLCQFIVGTRPGFNLNRISADIKKKVVLVQFPELDISSTDLRHRIKTGKSIKYLLPEKVEKYIYENRLYE